MSFEIFRAKRNGREYKFFIRNRDLPNDNWSLEDLLPYMQKVSDASTDYKLFRRIFDKAEGRARIVSGSRTMSYDGDYLYQREAVMSLGPSAVRDLKCLVVEPVKEIGSQMIHKFVRSIEGDL